VGRENADFGLTPISRLDVCDLYSERYEVFLGSLAGFETCKQSEFQTCDFLFSVICLCFLVYAPESIQ
jgi:hypothetical protein